MKKVYMVVELTEGFDMDDCCKDDYGEITVTERDIPRKMIRSVLCAHHSKEDAEAFAKVYFQVYYLCPGPNKRVHVWGGAKQEQFLRVEEVDLWPKED